MGIKREGESYVIETRHVKVVSEGLMPLLAVLGMALFTVFLILSAIF